MNQKKWQELVILNVSKREDVTAYYPPQAKSLVFLHKANHPGD